MREFGKVAVGGTFDELHRGHKILLLKAFEIGERVLIGLCSDRFVKRLGKPHKTASYTERLKDLRTFLTNLGIEKRAEVILLDDPFGPAVTDKCIEALVVSEETEKTANKINEQRAKNGMNPLKIITISMVPSEDCSPISTTRIRKGEIDHEGRLIKRSQTRCCSLNISQIVKPVQFMYSEPTQPCASTHLSFYGKNDRGWEASYAMVEQRIHHRAGESQHKHHQNSQFESKQHKPTKLTRYNRKM